MQIHVRKATAADVPHLYRLVKELALYERAPMEVTNTEEQMLRDGFGENPIYTAAVAEVEGEIVGMYFWYVRYSTWKGKGLYLEDIVVTEAMRGKKVGEALFRACMEDAKTIGAHYMTWQVLDWNEPAMNFYRKFNCTFDGGWVNARISQEKL